MLKSMNCDSITNKKVKWFVQLPHVRDVLGLFSNMKVAIWKFFLDLLVWTVPSVGQVLLRHLSQFVVHNHNPIS